jgi:hypothetical protein
MIKIQLVFMIIQVKLIMLVILHMLKEHVKVVVEVDEVEVDDEVEDEVNVEMDTKMESNIVIGEEVRKSLEKEIHYSRILMFLAHMKVIGLVLDHVL